jgi:SAM-dependent methyltransferase
MAAKAWIERVLFGHPQLYRLKRFLIEDVIWGFLLGGLLRLEPHPLPDLSERFAGRRVLVAACGPGDESTGPSVEAAAGVTAFDLSQNFARDRATRDADWQVYRGDVLRLPHRDDEFDVSVIYSSLHHIPAPAGDVLGELARVSRGSVVLLEGVVPPRGLLRRALLLWYRLVDGGHRYYTLEELRQVAASLGLEIAASWRCSPIRHMWLAELTCPQAASAGAGGDDEATRSNRTETSSA